MSTFDLHHDFLALALIALMLGIRHGFDADHLAAINGLARHNAQDKPRLARWCGALFSAGHGVVVVGVALSVSLLAQAWQAPRWLEPLGAWLSIGVLTLLAALNIASALATPGHRHVPLVGWRCGVFARLLRARNPATVMAVGSLFALSFDTVSQAALFAATAAQFGGWQPALLLALLFIAGMLVTDGINGWWISGLVRRSDRSARVASRVMALAVAAVGLLTAGLGVARRMLPDVGAWSEDRAMWIGVLLCALVLAGFAAGQWLARARLRATALAGAESGP